MRTILDDPNYVSCDDKGPLKWLDENGQMRYRINSTLKISFVHRKYIDGKEFTEEYKKLKEVKNETS